MSFLFTSFCILTGGPSFGLYDIKKSLTIPGWIALAIIVLILIYGAVKIVKYLKNTHGKDLK